MSVQRNLITGNPVLKWLLVMALVFVPFQGIMSMPAHDCHHDQAMNHETTIVHVTNNETLAAVSTIVTEENCCDHCDTNAVCDNACNVVHVDTFIIGLTASLVISEPHLLQQLQVLDAFHSQFDSPPLHPPKT